MQILIKNHITCTITALLSVFLTLAYAQQPLRVEQVSPHVYRHVSYLDAGSFGKVPCNGMIVFDGSEAIIFDTPAEKEDAIRLIHWVRDSLHAHIKAIVPTHFHDDCLGSLEVFHQAGITSYANRRTILLAKKKNLTTPQHAFHSSKKLRIGKEKIVTSFEGEGHTRDNIVAYVPADQVLFGGCLIKEIDAAKGNLADANTKVWAETVKNVSRKYPEAKIIIPGHGKPGDRKLLDYTISLFEN